MARYSVVMAYGLGPASAYTVRAGSLCAAYQTVLSRQLSHGFVLNPSWVTVVRRGLFRHESALFSGGSWPDDGTSGVREPRRPMPTLPQLTIELDEPI